MVDIRIVQCCHWRPRRKRSYGAYCCRCDTVILVSFDSLSDLIDTINHEVFHAIFCRWSLCDACNGLDKFDVLSVRRTHGFS